jgi:hypothetical protein
MENTVSGIGAEDLRSGTKWWGTTKEQMGAEVTGLIVSAEKAQQTDFDTGQGLEWENGDPRMESVIIMETDIRDPEVEDDGGTRALHLRGGNYEIDEGTGISGEKALLEAMQKSGLRCEAGVVIKAKITGMAKATGRGKKPAKLWTIRLEKAESSIDEGDLFD